MHAHSYCAMSSRPRRRLMLAARVILLALAVILGALITALWAMADCIPVLPDGTMAACAYRTQDGHYHLKRPAAALPASELHAYACSKTRYADLRRSQLADATTTLGGLAVGAAEANPLGLAVLPAKAAYLQWAYDHCTEIAAKDWDTAISIGYGLSIWNGITIVLLLL
jgi:hypothetical protein